MKKQILTIVLLSAVLPLLSMPGRLLVVGGGSERSQTTAWNKIPYQWAVDNAPNKKVAIIAFGPSTDTWLQDYFINQCGATRATYFNINSSAIADAQATYDSLINYDMIFLKGGDQYDYYHYYKGTKTQIAIDSVFRRGGVICGTSAGAAVLSDIVFTAQHGSVYPEEMLQNPLNNYATLANDFFQFTSGILFDTHFAERGRLGRLVGLIANWKLTHNQDITGIGVDDLTAFTVEPDGTGTVYGTGCISVIKAKGQNSFSTSQNELLADSVELIQLLHGCTYNLITGEFTGLQTAYTPSLINETGNYTVFASGGDILSNNLAMLQSFVDSVGTPADRILIVTGSSLTLANSFKARMETNGATNVHVISAIPANANDGATAWEIIEANKILLLDNDWPVFKTFLAGSTGNTMKKKLRSNEMISGFVGDNARFAGKTVIVGYNEAGASYYGDLIFDPGLGLLATTIIMPNTFLNSDYYENTVTSIPYAMIKKQARYGIWLTSKNFMKYAPENGKTYISTQGTVPLMMAINDASYGEFSTHTSIGDGSQTPRMIAGFDKMNLRLIDETGRIQMGDSVIISVQDIKGVEESIKLVQTGNQIIIDPGFDRFYLEVYSILGRKIYQNESHNEKYILNLSNYPKGVYVIRCNSIEKNKFKVAKFVNNK